MRNERIDRILDNMKKSGIDQLIVSSTSSIFYLTDSWIVPGERLLAFYLNVDGTRKFYLNALFQPPDDLEADLCVFNDSQDPIELLAAAVDPDKQLGIEKTMEAHFLIGLLKKHTGLLLENGSPAIDRARMIKDTEEIRLMRESSAINDLVMGDVVKILDSGLSEKAVCKALVDIYERHGASRFSFSPIVAFGANAADPHHDSDNSLAWAGDSLIIDIGGRHGQYCSDMTRTFFLGEPSEEKRRVFETVRQANQVAIDACRPGVRFCDVDRAAREVIEEAGYGEFFTHRTGHNIGIDVHEYPDVGEANEMPVEENMIFSIEPGIYLSGKCGVRIEDLVLTTADGCESLNQYPKELTVL